MEFKHFEYVDFRQVKKGFSYVYVGRTGFLLKKFIKFTVRSKSADITWPKVQALIKQHNYFIHDLAAEGMLHLGEVTVAMNDFTKMDEGRYGKDPERWKELGQSARHMQKALYDERS